ncbi:MAG: c-type cytochrome [Bacteroidetes bacterium]|nr:c-type cytochrome [Bacteroidota bacterium]
MEENKEKQSGSDYDGIEYREETRHKLPISFILIALVLLGFGIYYTPTYLPIVSGWTQEGEYNEEKALLEKKAASMVVDSVKYDQYFGDAAAIEAGKALYSTQPCAACHGPAGEGAIGPNLTDAEWVYGGDAKAIYKSIENGRPKGMPAYKGQIQTDDVLKLTAFVHSLSAK